LLFRVLLQSASTWQALGAPQLALAIVNGAETLLPGKDLRGRGWVLQLRASIQIDLAAFDDARANLDAAVQAFRKARRPYDRALALVAVARLGVARGDGKTAARDARKAAAYASVHKFTRVQHLAFIQEGRALLAAGEVDRALEVLARVLAQTVPGSDGVLRFQCHFYLSKAYAATGDAARSRLELEQARYFVRFVDPTGQEAAEVPRP
jgi:ATP/maltotriose-dependent transcriptional regulator MalT